MRISVYVVGSNPLPVMIALSYDCGLLEGIKVDGMPEKVVMVYSEDTEEYKENIEKWAKTKLPNLEFEGIFIDEPYNAIKIVNHSFNELKKFINNNTNKIDEIFVNATGGTKVMSLNTVLACTNLSNELNIKCNQIDIDTNKNKLIVFDSIKRENIDICPKGDKKIEELFIDLITIENIVYSYGYEFKSNKKISSKYLLESKEKTKEFARYILENEETYSKFQTIVFSIREFINNNQRMFANGLKININELYSKIGLECADEDLNDTDNTKSFIQFLNKEKPKKIENTEAIFNFFRSLGDKENKFVDKICDFGLLDCENKKYTIKNVNYKYITGIWLEEYIMSLVDDLLSDKKSYEIANNFKITPKGTKKEECDFEIDVVIRKGYEVTFISCTTDKGKSLANSKTREVLSNSQALGLRTKVILVTMFDKNSDEFINRNKAFSFRQYNDLQFITLNDLLKEELLIQKLKECLNI